MVNFIFSVEVEVNIDCYWSYLVGTMLTANLVVINRIRIDS